MSKEPVSNGAGRLHVVATPIGNLDDFSPRAVETLREVDLIAAEDTRHSRRLLQRHGITTPMVSLHEHNEGRMLETLLQRLEAGQRLALISDAGTPLISDPGFPLVRACHERGIAVSPVPGPSALIAALSASGLPADRFVFHGFAPRQPAARRAAFQEAAKLPGTQIFYESAHRIDGALADARAVLGDERRACLARELTKRYEELLTGTLAELDQALKADSQRRKGEFVLMIAPAPAAPAADLSPETLRILGLLGEELPPKRAAALAARITGEKKNRLYRALLDLDGGA